MSERSEKQPAFVAVYQPADQQQLMMIKMLLERENVNYYVDGEVSTLGATPGIPMRVMVEAARAEEIRNALRDELGLK